MRNITIGLAALAAVALTACADAPTEAAPPALRASVGEVAASATFDALEDAADRLLPAISASHDTRAIGAQLAAAGVSLRAGDGAAAAAAIDAALLRLDRLDARGDAADVDAVRLDLEAVRAALRAPDARPFNHTRTLP